jgi:hypothetical protein
MMEAMTLVENETGTQLAASCYEGWRGEWQEALAALPELSLFVLIDIAQEPSLLQQIRASDLPSACLYGYDADAPIARGTPRLVQIDPLRDEKLLSRLIRQSSSRPVATVIAASCSLAMLLSHLRASMDVQLEGHDDMFLAIWDPSILAALIGTNADKTLYVEGPVLAQEQAKALVGPIRHWWYWDRKGNRHDVAQRIAQSDILAADLPLQLNSEQVEMLVEASVPDHLIYHLGTNLPELLEKLPTEKRYEFVCQQLKRARTYGLEGTGDLVNYVAIALAFGAQFDEQAEVVAILRQVKAKKLGFDQAIKSLPEDEMSKAAQVPDLLDSPK